MAKIYPGSKTKIFQMVYHYKGYTITKFALSTGHIVRGQAGAHGQWQYVARKGKYGRLIGSYGSLADAKQRIDRLVTPIKSKVRPPKKPHLVKFSSMAKAEKPRRR